MSLFKRKPAKPNIQYDLDIVGESKYQAALEKLAGGRKEKSAFAERTATLIPEDDNPFDVNSVRVDIQGKTVGHLSRDAAKYYRQAEGKRSVQVPAVIIGGWDNGGGDVGRFGVRLALKLKTR